MQTIVIAVLLPIFNMILPLVSPMAREQLVKFGREWRQNCLNSDNQWDDGLSYMVCVLLAIPIDDIVPTVPTDIDEGVVVNLTEEERQILIYGGWKVYDDEDVPPEHDIFDDGGG